MRYLPVCRSNARRDIHLAMRSIGMVLCQYLKSTVDETKWVLALSFL